MKTSSEPGAPRKAQPAKATPAPPQEPPTNDQPTEQAAGGAHAHHPEQPPTVEMHHEDTPASLQAYLENAIEAGGWPQSFSIDNEGGFWVLMVWPQETQ